MLSLNILNTYMHIVKHIALIIYIFIFSISNKWPIAINKLYKIVYFIEKRNKKKRLKLKKCINKLNE